MDEQVAFLRGFFADRPDFETGVRRLLTYCRSFEPDAPWGEVEALDFGKDQASFNAWASRNLPEKDGYDPILAFYFGLSDDGGSIPMDGTEEYDESDDTFFEWACASVFESADDWGDSEVVGKFQTVSEAFDSDGPDLHYVLCLGYVGLLIQQWAPRALWVKSKREMPVAVGFNSGDAYVVLPVVAAQGTSQHSDEFRARIDQSLMESGGPLTEEERVWAREMLTPQKKKRTPSKP